MLINYVYLNQYLTATHMHILFECSWSVMSTFTFQAQSELSDQETVVYPDQLESSSLALRFRLQPEVLHNGRVVLKCVATLKHMHAETVKEIRAAGNDRLLIYSHMHKSVAKKMTPFAMPVSE